MPKRKPTSKSLNDGPTQVTIFSEREQQNSSSRKEKTLQIEDFIPIRKDLVFGSEMPANVEPLIKTGGYAPRKIDFKESSDFCLSYKQQRQRMQSAKAGASRAPDFSRTYFRQPTAAVRDYTPQNAHQNARVESANKFSNNLSVNRTVFKERVMSAKQDKASLKSKFTRMETESDAAKEFQNGQEAMDYIIDVCDNHYETAATTH